MFFLLQSADEAYHDGQARGLPIGPINSPDDLLDDEHLRAREFFVDVEHDDVPPARLSRAADAVLGVRHGAARAGSAPGRAHRRGT